MPRIANHTILDNFASDFVPLRLGEAMWADVDADVDFLNYSEVSELILDLVQDKKMLPVSIGVFGTWGTGKSTLLNLVETGLSDPDEERFIVVRFDAWLYQGFDDARAAVMEVIGGRLLEEVEQEENAGLLGKTRTFLGRINYLRGAGMLVDAGAAIMGVPTFGAATKGVGAIENLLGGKADKEDVESMREAAKDVADRGKGLVKAKEKRSPPEQIDAFRREFGEILCDLDKTLVVFVDNLDRCLPKQTIQTLEALRLFLFMDRTAFVVAADEDMVRHSVSRFFSDLDSRHVIDYLDKLIQVPIRLPKLGVQEVRAYLMMLFAGAAQPELQPDDLENLRSALEDDLRRAWEARPMTIAAALKLLRATPDGDLAKAFDTAARLAPILANTKAVGGNPRVVKRLLNVIRMRTRVAARRRMPLDEAVIAKLALFERCTDDAATADLYRQIQEAPDGRPELLAALERLLDDDEAFLKACPPSWQQQKNVDFIREWAKLEPSLGDTSLTAAVYLARDTTVMAASGRRLSGKGAEAAQVLLQIPSLSSKAGPKAIAEAPTEDHALIMEIIVADMRKRLPWSGRPDGFLGAMLLADTVPATAPAFLGLLRTAFPNKLDRWAAALVDAKSWYQQASA